MSHTVENAQLAPRVHPSLQRVLEHAQAIKKQAPAPNSLPKAVDDLQDMLYLAQLQSLAKPSPGASHDEVLRDHAARGEAERPGVKVEYTENRSGRVAELYEPGASVPRVQIIHNRKVNSEHGLNGTYDVVLREEKIQYEINNVAAVLSPDGSRERGEVFLSQEPEVTGSGLQANTKLRLVGLAAQATAQLVVHQAAALINASHLPNLDK